VNVSGSVGSSGRSAWRRQRATILRILVVPACVIAVVVSTILLGSTSHARPTGSVAGALAAAEESIRVSGVPSSDVTLHAALSSVDNHWALFAAEPKSPLYSTVFPGEYGYLHFDTRAGWLVAAVGVVHVGCATPSAPGTVPTAVIRGFHDACPSP
jgi:hypothetical protein